MRNWLSLLFLVTAICQARAVWVLDKWKVLGALPGNAVAWEGEVSAEGRTARLSGVSFGSDECVFRVIDSPPGEPTSLQAALTAAGASAGSNGGYFHKNFTPLGLAVAGGKTLHPFERAKLLSGVLAVRGERIELVRSGRFKPGKDIQEALQGGPWLVERGEPVAGLNAERQARRTLVANDGKGHWALVAISPVTLAEAARILCVKGVAGSWPVANALNLDGGSSTALRAVADDHALIDVTSFGQVRNYLAIVRRHR